MDDENGSTEPQGQPPRRLVTINQIVAWNLAWYRRAAGLTQGQLADLTGWTKSAISDAERSVSGKWTREFDAHSLVVFAAALEIPVMAFFMPPADDGEDADYYAEIPDNGKTRTLTMDDLMVLSLPISGSETPAMTAYRDRLNHAVGFYLDPYWYERVMRLIEDNGLPLPRDEYAAKLREYRDQARAQAVHWEQMAQAAETGGAQ